MFCSHSGKKYIQKLLVHQMYTFACLDLSAFTLLMPMIDLNQTPEPMDQNADLLQQSFLSHCNSHEEDLDNKQEKVKD